MSSINDKFNEVYAEFDPLIWNILRKYSNRGVLSSNIDDLHQEIWKTIWGIAVKNDEYPTYQISGIAKNVINSYIRKDIVRNSNSPWGRDQTRVPYYGTSDDDSEEQPGVTGVYADPIDQFKEYAQNEKFKKFIDQFINKYPEGSKERKYLDFYWDKANAKDYDDNWIDPNKRYRDGELAQMLGWSGTSSGGWKKFKAKMQQEIADYFEYEPEEKEFAPRGRTVKKD